MKEAFVYMFKDNKFWMKGLCYLGLVFIANFLTNYGQTLLPVCPRCSITIPWQYWACLICGTIISLIPLGYVYACIKALIEQDETNVLPYMNPLKNLIAGFKYAIAMLLLLIPLLIITMIIISGIAYVSNGAGWGLIISKIIMLTAIIGFIILLPGFNWIFANKTSFLTFFRFKKMFEIIAACKGKYFTNLGMVCLVFIINMLLEAGAGFTVGLVHIPTIAGLIIVGIFAALTGTYTAFINIHLIAKAVNKELAETI